MGLLRGEVADAAATAAGVNETVTLPGIFTESAVSVAVKETDSALVSETANVAEPEESVDTELGVMTTVALDDFRATALPDTGNPSASKSSTVMIAVDCPSAGTLEALETMTQSSVAGSIGGGVPKVTVTVGETARSLSSTSIASNPTNSGVVSVTVNVAVPFAWVTGETAVITACPSPWVNWTVLPATGLPKWSLRTTEIVDAVLPSASTALGVAEMVDAVPSTGPAAKLTVSGVVGANARLLSVTSVAVSVTVSATVSRTWNSASPSGPVTPATPVPLGRIGVIDTFTSGTVRATFTVLPDNGFPFESLTVTRTFAVARPSAVTGELGWMTTVERVAEGVGPCDAWNTTVAVWTMGIESAVSLAVKVTDSATVSVTANCTVPAVSEVPDAGCTPAVVDEAISVTVLPATGDAPPAVLRVTMTVVPPPVPTTAGDCRAETVESEPETTRLPKVTVAGLDRVTVPTLAV